MTTHKLPMLSSVKNLFCASFPALMVKFEQVQGVAKEVLFTLALWLLLELLTWLKKRIKERFNQLKK